jgi:uncharacterized membrane protein YheB (UPF0754 family)
MDRSIAYVSLPIISAAIGWATNWIAVKMLFRPRRPFRILGLRIQGLVPLRQADLARKIGETVESRLLTHEDIHAAIVRPEVQAEIGRLVAAEVERFFRERLAALPMAGLFLQGEMAQKLKLLLIEQLRGALPGFLDALMEEAQKTLDLKAIVQRKIESFDLSTLEGIVYDIASKELKLIEVLGGVLGFVIGLGQAALLWLSA